MIPVEDFPLNNAHLLILCNISNLSLQRSFCLGAPEWRGVSSQDQIRLRFAAANSWNRDTPPPPILSVNPSASGSHFLPGGLSSTPPCSHLELLLWKSVPHTFQTVSHLSHLFFFETLTRGHTVSVNPVSLRRGFRPLIHPVLTRTGPRQYSPGWTTFPICFLSKTWQGQSWASRCPAFVFINCAPGP